MHSNNKPLEVFYAEDSVSDRMLFEVSLQEINTPVNLSTAENGKEAMEILESRSDYIPDIIILDYRMPYKNGNECLAEIRGKEKYRNTLVAIFTTSANPRDIEDAYARKANLYMQKPFQMDTQVKLIEKLLTLDKSHYFPQPPMEQFVLEV